MSTPIAPAVQPGVLSGSILALFLGGLALRPQHVVVGPLLPLIQAELAVPHATAGLLATIPLICMGLFALPAPAAANRIGTRHAIGLSIALVALFGALRAVAPSSDLIIALTIPVGIGMGLGGALLPQIVKERFASRPAFATGVYTNGFQVGSAIVSAAAVPAAFILGGWRAALLVLSLAIAVLAIAWYAFIPSDRRASCTPAPVSRWPIRQPLVWGLVLLFGLRSMIFQGLMAWLPSAYVERGWSEAAAGLLVFALVVVGLPVTVGATWLADRAGSRRTYLGLASAGLLLSIAGLVLVPELGIVWALLIGASLGVLFPLTMTLPLDIADRPGEVSAAASMMFGLGYLIAALSPVGLGAIRDVTGSFSASLASLLVVTAAVLALTLVFTPEQLAKRRPVGPG